MRFHILQHVPFEGPARFLDWTTIRQVEVGYTRFYDETWALPALDEFDALLVLGGPMGAYDTDKFPWLIEEIAFLKTVIASGKKMVGICLGSQLLAAALGSNVYPHAHREIGWWRIYKMQPHPIFNEIPDAFTVFHWHGDTFDMPEGAVHLARSNGCENQAYIWNDQVLGLQFHMEMGEVDIRSLLVHFKGDLDPDQPFVQSSGDIISGFPQTEVVRLYLNLLIERFMTLGEGNGLGIVSHPQVAAET